MSRYDGLIIPRSYSEYINKTDAATLQQALQLSGVLSGAVAAGDNKAVTSAAVATALAGYQKGLVNASGQEITIPSNTTLIIYCHHPYTNNNDYLGFVLSYNDVISVFTIANTNADLPFTTNGNKIIFKGDWWLVKTAVISVFL